MSAARLVVLIYARTSADAIAIQENEKHGIEHRDLDIQFDKSRQAVDRFSKVQAAGFPKKNSSNGKSMDCISYEMRS